MYDLRNYYSRKQWECINYNLSTLVNCDSLTGYGIPNDFKNIYTILRSTMQGMFSFSNSAMIL